MVELSVVIPFFNEEKNVENVVVPIVNSMGGAKIDYELVLVENGSKDRTGEVIDKLMKQNKRIKKCLVETNLGYGFGVNKGLSQCKGAYLGWVDGDGQVTPDTLLKIFNSLKENNADFGKGIRKVRGDGMQRIINSFSYNNLVNIFFNSGTNDINAKPKIFKKEIYDRALLVSRDWFIDTELVVKVRKMNYKFVEIPIEFFKRKEGKSNVSFKTIIEFSRNLLHFRKQMKEFSSNLHKGE